MPFGTIRNPLTLGASGQSDGSAYRALAESLASQQMQAGPSSGLNVLQAILGPLAQVANMNRAAEADSAYEQNRMKQYEEFQARQAEQERAQQTAAAAGQRAEREKVADANGLTGLVRAQFLMTGEIPAQAFKGPERAKRYEVGGALVDENGKVLFQAPDKPNAPSEIDRKVATLRQLGASDEQIRAALMGGGGAQQAPSGYRQTADGSLEPIPGGPADKKATPPALGAEVTNKLSLLDNAIANAKKYQAATVRPDGSFADIASMSGATPQLIKSAVQDMLYAKSGASAPAEEVSKAEAMYSPGFFERDSTAAAKVGNLLADLERMRATIGGGAQPQQGAPQQGAQTKAGPVGSITTVNGKRYRVVGGDPNDPDMEPVD